MEKDSQHMTPQELDGLLKEAFLKLDFESSELNEQAVDAASRRVMRKNSWISLEFNPGNVFLLIVSVIVITQVAHPYVLESARSENDQFAQGIWKMATTSPAVLHTQNQGAGQSTSKRDDNLEVDVGSTKKTDIPSKKETVVQSQNSSTELATDVPPPAIEPQFTSSQTALIEEQADQQVNTTDKKDLTSASRRRNIVREEQSGAASPLENHSERKSLRATFRKFWMRISHGKNNNKSGTLIMKGNKYKKSRRH